MLHFRQSTENAIFLACLTNKLHLTDFSICCEPVAVSGESAQKLLDWVTGVSNGCALVLAFEMFVFWCLVREPAAVSQHKDRINYSERRHQRACLIFYFKTWYKFTTIKSSKLNYCYQSSTVRLLIWEMAICSDFWHVKLPFNARHAALESDQEKGTCKTMDGGALWWPQRVTAQIKTNHWH